MPRAPPQLTPTPGSSAGATRRLCRSASAQHARKPTAAPGLGGKRSGARPALERTSPGARPAGVYLSHLLKAGDGQAGTTVCFTFLLLPRPESTQPPKVASPVTTTTNKQPPARSHCAGARQRREQRSAAGADECRHRGAPRGRRRRARLLPEGFLGSFFFPRFPHP